MASRCGEEASRNPWWVQRLPGGAATQDVDQDGQRERAGEGHDDGDRLGRAGGGLEVAVTLRDEPEEFETQVAEHRLGDGPRGGNGST